MKFIDSEIKSQIFVNIFVIMKEKFKLLRTYKTFRKRTRRDTIFTQPRLKIYTNGLLYELVIRRKKTML